MKNESNESLTKKQTQEFIKNKFQDICFFCSEKGTNFHRKVSRSSGGKFTIENVIMSCIYCSNKRNNMAFDDFITFINKSSKENYLKEKKEYENNKIQKKVRKQVFKDSIETNGNPEINKLLKKLKKYRNEMNIQMSESQHRPGLRRRTKTMPNGVTFERIRKELVEVRSLITSLTHITLLNHSSLTQKHKDKISRTEYILQHKLVRC